MTESCSQPATPDPDWRIYVEEATGFEGHRWIDITDLPFPAITASRVVSIMVTGPLSA